MVYFHYFCFYYLEEIIKMYNDAITMITVATVKNQRKYSRIASLTILGV